MKARITKKLGKLISIELEYDKTITSCKITGDFFLHPEEQIILLEKSIVDAPIPIQITQLTTSIEESIKNATLIGATAEQIAELVKEATTQKWRVIPVQEHDAFTNMALDEAICEAVKNKESLPTIRFYTWNPGAVSIGYFQGIKNELDLEECEKQQVDYIRRRTGGGAVFHDTEGEITYTIIAPEEFFHKDIVKSYEQICEPIITALKTLNITAKFAPINDIQVNDKKISGNAQTRKGGILQQHGTILYKVDVDKMFSLLKVGKEKIADKLIQSVKKRVTSIYDENAKITKQEVIKALQDAFSQNRTTEIGEYSQTELLRAKELKENKYKTQEWNFQR